MRLLHVAPVVFSCATACAAPSFDGLKLEDNPLGDGCTPGEAPREPDLMRWRPDGRAQLALLRAQGIVAVVYKPNGCDLDLEVLPSCIGKGQYTFAPYSSEDARTSRSESELKANLPVGGGIALGGYFQKGEAIRTDLQLAGLVALPAGKLYSRDDLEGLDCDRATHVVARIYLGGFSIVAGKAQEIEGGASFFGAELSARGAQSVERVRTEGELKGCEVARAEGREVPTCNVPLRVGLLPLGTAIDPQSYLPDPGTGLVPLAVADQHGCIDKNQVWDGARCGNVQARPVVCPEGSYLPDGASECKACSPHVLARGCP